MRWSAATENWHPLHFDWKYATEHDGLPDVLVSGSWKQHVLIQLLSDWVKALQRDVQLDLHAELVGQTVHVLADAGSRRRETEL